MEGINAHINICASSVEFKMHGIKRVEFLCAIHEHGTFLASCSTLIGRPRVNDGVKSACITIERHTCFFDLLFRHGLWKLYLKIMPLNDPNQIPQSVVCLNPYANQIGGNIKCMCRGPHLFLYTTDLKPFTHSMWSMKFMSQRDNR